MLWAIYRIYRAIRATEGIRDLFDQRMIIYHIITFVLYIVSTSLSYAFYYLQDTHTSSETYTDYYYISWTIAFVLLACAQVILIYIFWGLNRPQVSPGDSAPQSPVPQNDSVDEDAVDE